MPPLLSTDDYVTFAGLDINWFITGAGAVIRRFCSWHVYPSLTETKSCVMGGDGTIIIPSGFVTSIESITLPWNNQTLDSSTYWLDQAASVVHWTCISPNGQGYWWGSNPQGSLNAYPKYNRHAIVEFTHGYDVLPPEVAEVGMELAMRALEKPAGVASEIRAGPYSYVFNEFGLLLTESQKSKLSAFRLPAIF